MLLGLVFLGAIMELTEQELAQWRLENSHCKKYAHFDNRVSLANDAVWRYVTDPARVAKHGFYPFIQKMQRTCKYDKHKPKADSVTKKDRPLCYAAHIDDLIFRYYALRLNKQYNARVLKDGLDDAAIAYRTNHPGEDNITFAKRAIDFIKDSGDCYVIIGDFKSFFDTLNHSYLKERLCDLLCVKKLPDDYYAVFRNITKFSTWDFETLICMFNNNDFSAKGIRKFNERPRVMSPAEFKANKDLIVSNEQCGIPQGSAISGILANIYMLDADKKINDCVKKSGGLYMRYCDDFIVVLPHTSAIGYSEFYNWIMKYIASLEGDKTKGGLTLSPDKTKSFHYCDGVLTRCDNDENSRKKTLMDYLGFTFDGKEVLIRDRAFTKYYNRMYKKARGVVMMNALGGYAHYSAHKLYKVYSVKGAYGDEQKKANFITYVNRAAKEFNNPDITRPINRHLRKIKSALNPYCYQNRLSPDELKTAADRMGYMYLSRRQKKKLNKMKSDTPK